MIDNHDLAKNQLLDVPKKETKKAPRRRHNNTLPFTDLLFNLLVGITMLFLLAFILIRPIVQDKEIESKAEFIVTMSWPDHHNSDVDLWVRDPLGGVVGFTSKEVNFTTLERDDIGSNRDQHMDNRGNLVYNPVNYEIITVRGLLPGEWAVNIHYYASRAIPEGHISGHVTPPYSDSSKIPVEVVVKVVKLNPVYKVISEKTIILTNQGEERTMARFILDDEGEFARFIDAPVWFVIRSGGNGRRGNGGGIDGR